MTESVSDIFDPSAWHDVAGFEGLTDVTYHHDAPGRIARIAFNRPEVRNAFRPRTVDELYRALDDARQNSRIGVVLITGNGPSQKDGGWAFCSGGDQRIRGRAGYEYDDETSATGRLHILEVQRLIRFMPKVVIAVVPGWAAGGGHSLHVVCDLTIASREHARFKQTDADVGSFDAGYGSAYFARQVGQKFAREVFFLAREYDAQRALDAGAINAVVDHADLEKTAIEWRLVAAIAYQESQWDPAATSATGVRGFMQITGDTARHLGITDLLDPAQNVIAAARYLRDLKAKLPLTDKPILVLNPNDDLWEQTPRARSLIKNGRIHDIPDNSHGFLDTITADVGRWLREFLDKP